jgi:methylthioribose-1-phosphate isomerase
MQRGDISAVTVGCDRVAANGDVANKIGTSGLAVLAKYYGVPFYVFCPTSTLDLSCKSGADIVIEERDGSEITDLYFAEQIAPKGVKTFNPSFDVTPAELITAIITEKGIMKPHELA